MLNIKSCVVTIDTMGTQTKIVEQIIEEESDIFLQLKGIRAHWKKKLRQPATETDLFRIRRMLIRDTGGLKPAAVKCLTGV
jgi:predicted transposase YbfD/YdcC